MSYQPRPRDLDATKLQAPMVSVSCVCVSNVVTYDKCYPKSITSLEPLDPWPSRSSTTSELMPLIQIVTGIAVN